MNLRKLRSSDAPLMLEWMHDPFVVKHMQADFGRKSLADCENFVRAAVDTSQNLHMAIVDEKDVYMGTVSLKNICAGTAELAITMRSCAMGKGYSRYAMSEIINIGLEELHLDVIYWYVDSENKRALRFYDKNGYKRVVPQTLGVPNSKNFGDKYIWYSVGK